MRYIPYSKAGGEYILPIQQALCRALAYPIFKKLKKWFVLYILEIKVTPHACKTALTLGKEHHTRALQLFAQIGVEWGSTIFISFFSRCQHLFLFAAIMMGTSYGFAKETRVGSITLSIAPKHSLQERKAVFYLYSLTCSRDTEL